jgi:hypothetical protein
MAVKITYLDKDAFINSKNSNENTGIDEIISIGSYTDTDSIRAVQRLLLKPKTNQIIDLINTRGITDYEVNLRLKSSSVKSLPQTVVLYSNAIKTHDDIDWTMGYGKQGDIPQDISGVSWETITGAEQSIPWIYESGSSETEIPYEATASFYNIKGGGTWYSGSNYEYTTSLDYRGLKLDPVIDITRYVKSIQDSEIKDNGLIVRFGEDLENSDRDYEMNLFSRETNTIFYPTVHMYWDDQVYDTSTMSVIEDDNLIIKVSNSKKEYYPVGETRLELHVRPQYPARKFTTGSIYLEKYALPETSVWALEDYYTGEVIIPFKDMYTRVSCDTKSPYINLDMSMLPLGRYYRILVKTNINNSDIVKTLDPFKVTRHG